MLLHSKSWRWRCLSGWSLRVWSVRWFRRPVRYRSKEDDDTLTPIVLWWQSGNLGGRGSPISALYDAWCRKHGWRCSSVYSRPSATARPTIVQNDCLGPAIGASAAAWVAVSWSTGFVQLIYQQFFQMNPKVGNTWWSGIRRSSTWRNNNYFALFITKNSPFQKGGSSCIYNSFTPKSL